MNDLLSKRQAFAEDLILEDGFLPDIFEVMLEAWTRVIIPDKKTSEPRITSLWKDQCRDVNRERHWDVGSQFDFFHEVQKNDPNTGKQISRKDIEVRWYGHGSCNNTKREAPYLVVESKKLADSDDIFEYVGKNGMLCFITRKYDPFQSFVAMAAYVMIGEINKWKSVVLKRVENSHDCLNTLDIHPSWIILPKHPQHCTTRHLIDGKSIFIHHLFLEAKAS